MLTAVRTAMLFSPSTWRQATMNRMLETMSQSKSSLFKLFCQASGYRDEKVTNAVSGENSELRR
jgi:hypothetical protein